MKLLIATGNAHKLDEIRAVLDAGFELVSLKDVGLGDLDEPVEDAETFAGNAEIKARYYAQHAGLPCLADDSGLVVDALGGAPGVISARYAMDDPKAQQAVGMATSWRDAPRALRDCANNAKLLRALEGVPAEQRTARFACSICVVGMLPEVTSADSTLTAEGAFEGRILTPGECEDSAKPWLGVGEHGFGYDPLFWLEDVGMTSAELPPEAKNARSHRGLALRALEEQLRGLAGGE
ncbi:MAG: non-canonical purine NTP pyrophosphatase [Planctomycetota bacterium]